ncbi:hypothetical protein UAW_00835 [Enterococcus haemoperoxidus ATCC BAA-382]|uniref:Uncharacterized protein n=1 Tax=Enterococcus haemoperoxidus ATCC BAA-382 TaxID=1158608 RepID=R2QT30_9ENTE|nr:hypothetical protein [Enterococcus haemoperoxidus]EOH99682.1 hypothetical protein UAW_00835 [Enterococcus haemoperoxidus ATCC BAA-382]EOT62578.1 hypothetical protein I583_01578 [Enterococcus haemoperoxidus ATCC BAA-382]OJG55043.1 hypothetical protein RV06_GL002080 [Enterococcus haemoperoxidus]
MKKVQLNEFSINYDIVQTEQCPVMLDEQLYIEDKKLPRYFIGETTMTFFDFYHADSPDFQETDYRLSERFLQIIGRFPHTNQKKIALNESESYSIKQVPVYVTAKDYILAENNSEKYAKFREKMTMIQSLTPIIEDEAELVVGYKRKRLLLDGTYGSRELLEKGQEKNVQAIQEKLEYVNEMYYFAHYSYAAMVQFLPEYDITTYDQFHKAYGKFVYSFTITKNGKTIPLLWPDYLYHKPENHLEFGLLANTRQPRYLQFDEWEAKEPIMIEILADGFEDVRFETHLKQPMNVQPKLSKSEYTLGETICLSLDSGLIKELAKQEAKFELYKTKKTSENGYSLNYELLEEQLLMPSAQFEKTGRYQLKITSDVYGQLLFLFTIKQEG